MRCHGGLRKPDPHAHPCPRSRMTSPVRPCPSTHLYFSIRSEFLRPPLYGRHLVGSALRLWGSEHVSSPVEWVQYKVLDMFMRCEVIPSRATIPRYLTGTMQRTWSTANGGDRRDLGTFVIADRGKECGSAARAYRPLAEIDLRLQRQQGAGGVRLVVWSVQKVIRFLMRSTILVTSAGLSPPLPTSTPWVPSRWYCRGGRDHRAA